MADPPSEHNGHPESGLLAREQVLRQGVVVMVVGAVLAARDVREVEEVEVLGVAIRPGQGQLPHPRPQIHQGEHSGLSTP